MIMVKAMDLRDSIEIERKALGISLDCFSEVQYYAEKHILQQIWNRFTKLGHQAEKYFWINHHLIGDVIRYQPKKENDITKILVGILPPQEIVWFIGQETKNEQPKYWLYEAKVNSVIDILDNMYVFDFYIVNKKYHWLVTQEHHGILLAVGDPIAERLNEYKLNNL